MCERTYVFEGSNRRQQPKEVKALKTAAAITTTTTGINNKGKKMIGFDSLRPFFLLLLLLLSILA